METKEDDRFKTQEVAQKFHRHVASLNNSVSSGKLIIYRSLICVQNTGALLVQRYSLPHGCGLFKQFGKSGLVYKRIIEIIFHLKKCNSI